MSQAAVGARVRYCGHEAVFIADIYRIGNVNVIRVPTNPGQRVEEVLDRRKEAYDNATHHISDFPTPGFWRTDLGVFVIPEKQCTLVKK